MAGKERFNPGFWSGFVTSSVDVTTEARPVAPSVSPAAPAITQRPEELVVPIPRKTYVREGGLSLSLSLARAK